ncbi:MAG: hypothetical protein WCP08_12415 [Prolixibacteraceae bacterium]
MVTSSSWADVPINLTEGLGDQVWSGAGIMPIPGGFIHTKNDAVFLYAALDIVGDTGNDSGVGDFFWFTFDRNRDGNITPNVDVNYGQYPQMPEKIGRQFYLAPGTWTGLNPDQTEFKTAFESSPNGTTPHRIWKFKFKLTDLNVSLAPSWLPPFTRFGVKIHSANPSLNVDSPTNFWMNFAGLHILYFSRRPVISPSLMGPVIGCVGLIPTTRINNLSGKATTDPGYMVYVQNAAFGGLLNIIGNQPNLHSLISASGARYIKIKHRVGTSGAMSDFITAWYNYRWDIPTGDYVLVSFGPDMANFYPLQDLTLDYSIHDLLFQFDSGQLSQGIHQFQVEFYNAAKAPIAVPAQILTLNIDNTVPIVRINSIKHGVTPLNTCDIVQMTGPTDGLVVNFDANDPENNVLSYQVYAVWGEGSSATLASENYNLAKGDWAGVQNQNTPLWIPVRTCAHSINVLAYSRTTNGYGYIRYNSVSRNITIMK